MMGRVSSGRRVRRSITSASIPSWAIFSAASSETWSILEYETMVTSLPGRFTSETPMGTRKSSLSGTSPFTWYSVACSMKNTGSSSRMADFSSPLASAGVPGATTFRPGKWAQMASGVCEWVAPSCRPPPPTVRRTMGTRIWPLNM